MSLGLACFVPGEGSVILTDSLTRRVLEDGTFGPDGKRAPTRKNFRIESVHAGVFVSGIFADLESIIARRTETDLEECALRLFADLRRADEECFARLHEPHPSYSPQLIVATSERLLLMTPEFVFAPTEKAMCAAGGWVHWFLASKSITSDLYRRPTPDLPASLAECKTLMRELALGCTSMIQPNAPLVSEPLHELTITPDAIHEATLHASDPRLTD